MRALMVLVLVLGGGLGWVVHRAHVQRDAVAAIQEAGGRVVYQWARSEDYPPPRPAPTGPALWPGWLVRALGPDYFGDVIEVYLGHTSRRRPDLINDDLMAHVGRLNHLEVLWLHANYHNPRNPSAPLTDAGLEALGGLPRVRRLELRYIRPEVMGTYLRHLGSMPDLKSLELVSVSVPDDALAALARRPRLKWLRLFCVRGCSRAGLADLQRLYPEGEIVLPLELRGVETPGS